MEELPSFGCRWCCKAALCVFFYPLPLFVAFTPEYILPSCHEFYKIVVQLVCMATFGVSS